MLRLFHCEGDHLGIMMFGSNLQDGTNWFVNLATNLVGVPSGGMDFIAPRWSNHVQYFTAAYPMGDNYESYMEDQAGAMPWGQSATWVQTQLDMLKMPKVFIGKFSADFRTQEKSMLIASDPRYVQTGGDAWICSGTTYGNQCGGTSMSPAIRRDDQLRGLSIVQSGAFVNIESNGKATVRITDARGKLVRQVTGSGSIAVDTRDLATGAYIVSARQQGSRLTKQVTIAR